MKLVKIIIKYDFQTSRQQKIELFIRSQVLFSFLFWKPNVFLHLATWLINGLLPCILLSSHKSTIARTIVQRYFGLSLLLFQLLSLCYSILWVKKLFFGIALVFKDNRRKAFIIAIISSIFCHLKKKVFIYIFAKVLFR